MAPLVRHCESEYDLSDSPGAREAAISTGIYLLSRYVQGALDSLTKKMGVPEEQRPLITAKNELLYSRIVLTRNKKQYVGLQVAREGHRIDPPELDMKGLKIKKIEVNPRVRGYFTDLIRDEVLGAEEVDLAVVLGRFRDLEEEIRDSLARGEVTFAVPANVNEISSYKFPYRIAPLRGAIAWNMLEKGRDIVFPDKVNTVKLRGKKLEQLEPIFGTPQFETIRDGIFGSDSLEAYGLQILSMPKTEERIPAWAVPLVDVDAIVADNLRSGLIILESLGVRTLEILGLDHFSNIVQI